MRRFLISLCALCASLLSFSQPSQPKPLPWRGLMLDVSRHFFPISFLKKQIDVMSEYKFNRLHIHLTDAAGWRIEIKRYPRLNNFAAWRSGKLWKDWNANGNKYLEQGSSVLAMRGQLYSWAYGKCLVCRIHSASRAGALHMPTVQPKAGRSENIYFDAKVSKLHPPSSLGLDGDGTFLPWHDDLPKVQKKPSSPYSLIAEVRDNRHSCISPWQPNLVIKNHSCSKHKEK